jgi:hypothetical protein
VLAINTGSLAVPLKLAGSPADVYALSAPSLKSSTVLLNGRPLTLGPDNHVPELHPRRTNGMHLTLAPQTMDFIGLPHARNPNCR